MTYARRRLVGLGRLDEIRLALFNSFVMLNSSTDRIYVNVSASVMITSALHLVGNQKKKEKNPFTVT